MNDRHTKALQRAFAHFGSQAALASVLHVTPMAVTHWKRRGVPPRKAVRIEYLTGGRITRQELCPELFGEAISGGGREA